MFGNTIYFMLTCQKKFNIITKMHTYNRELIPLSGTTYVTHLNVSVFDKLSI